MTPFGFPTFANTYERIGTVINSDGTTCTTFRHEHCILTVTYNQPSADALNKFIHTWHEILLDMVDQSHTEPLGTPE
ncbi:MAG: hypothetical protein ACYCYO_22305 [Bacilli bacterium]